MNLVGVCPSQHSRAIGNLHILRLRSRVARAAENGDLHLQHPPNIEMFAVLCDFAAWRVDSFGMGNPPGYHFPVGPGT